MIEGLQRHCYGCDNNLPATEEYFYPSYLKDGRNLCKSCHAKGTHTRESFRDKLREVAHYIQPDEVPSYQSLNSVAKNLGWSVAKVERDIYENKVTVYKFTYNNVGPALALKNEDAEAYIAAHHLNGQSRDPRPQVENVGPAVLKHEDAETSLATHSMGERIQGPHPQVETEPPIAGTPDQCASCGTTKGNILAVLDEKREIRAYLCSTCYRTASSYKWEPNRMRRMADLIERIGIQYFTV